MSKQFFTTMSERSQSAMEYLILTSMFIIVLMPFFYGTATRVEGYRDTTLIDATESVKNAIDTLINLGVGAATRVVVLIPKGVHNYDLTNNVLTITLDHEDGRKVITTFPRNLVGIFPTKSGRHFINLFNDGQQIFITECWNDVVEGFEQCDDSDGDGFDDNGVVIPCNYGEGEICIDPNDDPNNGCKCTCDEDTDCPDGYICDNDVCVPGWYCGDLTVTYPEECDSADPFVPGPFSNCVGTEVCGKPNTPFECKCSNALCGDGARQPVNALGLPEECDGADLAYCTDSLGMKIPTCYPPNLNDPFDPANPQCTCFECDEDDDGYLKTHPLCGGNDCNDNDPSIHPNAVEVCDCINNDCDDTVDESCQACTDPSLPECDPSVVLLYHFDECTTSANPESDSFVFDYSTTGNDGECTGVFDAEDDPGGCRLSGACPTTAQYPSNPSCQGLRNCVGFGGPLQRQEYGVFLGNKWQHYETPYATMASLNLAEFTLRAWAAPTGCKPGGGCGQDHDLIAKQLGNNKRFRLQISEISSSSVYNIKCKAYPESGAYADYEAEYGPYNFLDINNPDFSDFHYFACTYKIGEPLKLYVDGTLVAESLNPDLSTRVIDFRSFDGEKEVGVGNHHDIYCSSEGKGLLGIMDEVLIANEAWNGNMICDDFNSFNHGSLPPCVSCVSTCGNNNPECGEQCDDGANGDDTDQCTDFCTFTYCGDNIVQVPNGYGVSEACDDGNANNNDDCVIDSGAGNLCVAPFCGDGYIWNQGAGTETCDDGNTNSGDGCDDVCQIEACVEIYDSSSNLKSVWHMNDDFLDSAGNNDGSCSGSNCPVFVPGKLGSGLHFDGLDPATANDYVDTGTWTVSSGSITIAAWINAENGVTFPTGPRIISKASGTGVSQHQWMLGLYRSVPGNYQLWTRLKIDSNTEEIFAPSWTISPNTWTHVALTYDGSVVRFYVNGQEVHNDPSYPGFLSASGFFDRVHIGNSPANFNPPFSEFRTFPGIIDDLGVWDQALSQPQIDVLYQSGNLCVDCDVDNDGCNADNGLGCAMNCGGEWDCSDDPIADPNAANRYPTNLETAAAGTCTDGFDNDCDVVFDCDDPSCFGESACCGNNRYDPAVEECDSSNFVSPFDSCPLKCFPSGEPLECQCSTCGDGYCDPGDTISGYEETCMNCPVGGGGDCGPVCACDSGENEDCPYPLEVCFPDDFCYDCTDNNQCETNDVCYNGDCYSECNNDGTCDPWENCAKCALDCGLVCGDSCKHPILEECDNGDLGTCALDNACIDPPDAAQCTCIDCDQDGDNYYRQDIPECSGGFPGALGPDCNDNDENQGGLEIYPPSGTCTDGFDNDCDGNIDCADPACSTDPSCGGSCNSPPDECESDGDCGGAGQTCQGCVCVGGPCQCNCQPNESCLGPPTCQCVVEDGPVQDAF